MSDDGYWDLQMNLRSLRLFRRIVITGSLAEASNDLNVSVSAASRLLTLLEAELKLSLFSRAKRRLELTEEGDLFYRQVEHILRGLDELGQVSNDIRKRTRERLSLVTAAPIAMGLISPTLAAMRRESRDFECLINVETRFDIESKVAARAYNLGIISLPIENAIVDLAIEPFLESRLVVAMPVGHPLAERREIDVETLASQPLVALTAGQRWRERLDEVFATGSLQPRIEIETTSTPVVMQLVREGIGLTVVDQVCGQVAGNGIVMRPLSPERWITYASIHPQGPRQPLADRFVDAMCDWIESRRNADAMVAQNLRLI
jgi:DNA-binding transcriptional LysR family regulator